MGRRESELYWKLQDYAIIALLLTALAILFAPLFFLYKWLISAHGLRKFSAEYGDPVEHLATYSAAIREKDEELAQLDEEGAHLPRKLDGRFDNRSLEGKDLNARMAEIVGDRDGLYFAADELWENFTVSRRAKYAFFCCVVLIVASTLIVRFGVDSYRALSPAELCILVALPSLVGGVVYWGAKLFLHSPLADLEPLATD